MEIVEWRNWDDEVTKHYFKNMPVKLTYTEEEYHAVADAVRKCGYRFPGDYHQNGYHGVPIFENGKPFQVTQREWGRVMALAWPEFIKKIKSKLEKEDTRSCYDYIYYTWTMDEFKNTYNYPKKEEEKDEFDLDFS